MSTGFVSLLSAKTDTGTGSVAEILPNDRWNDPELALSPIVFLEKGDFVGSCHLESSIDMQNWFPAVIRTSRGFMFGVPPRLVAGSLTETSLPIAFVLFGPIRGVRCVIDSITSGSLSGTVFFGGKSRWLETV